MEIKKGIKIVDLGLYLTKTRTLILSDLHIGYEASLAKQGYLIPSTQFKDIIDSLTKILKKIKPKTIIFNGDTRDNFGRISDEEWRNTLKLIDFLKKHSKNIFLVKGNHDRNLKPLADKRNLQVTNQIIIDDILIMHGDKLLEIPKEIKTIVIGHEHPAIDIRDGARVERFKCFLKGKYKRKDIIVMPAFNPLSRGKDVLTNKRLSPFLQQNLKNFNVYIVADKVYDFGLLKRIG